MRLTEIDVGNQIVLDKRPSELGRAEVNKQVDVLKKLLPNFPKQCSDIIKVYRDTQAGGFYRGIKSGSSILLKSIRKDRTTIEMPTDYAAMIVDAYEAVGVAAHRQNSIFVTPSASTASDWGDVFIVFPLNGYRFSYFTGLGDSYAFGSLQRAVYVAKAQYDSSYEEQIATIVKVLNDKGLTQENLGYALRNNCETLFTGTQYYAFASSHWSEALRRWLQL